MVEMVWECHGWRWLLVPRQEAVKRVVVVVISPPLLDPCLMCTFQERKKVKRYDGDEGER